MFKQAGETETWRGEKQKRNEKEIIFPQLLGMKSVVCLFQMVPPYSTNFNNQPSMFQLPNYPTYVIGDFKTHSFWQEDLNDW